MSISNRVNLLFILIFSFILVSGVALAQGTNRSSLSCILIVQTDKALGTGFVLQSETNKFILTNQHVIQGAKEIKFQFANGKVLDWVTMELGDSDDLARFTFKNDTAVDGLRLASKLPTIGEPVKIYGNSQGVGALTEVAGKVLAVGPEILEVDAGFVQGNSGSPICAADDSVLGVATYVTKNLSSENWVEKGTRFTEVRRFGIRLDREIRWVKVNNTLYQTQAFLLSDINAQMCDLVSLLSCWTVLQVPGREWWTTPDEQNKVRGEVTLAADRYAHYSVATDGMKYRDVSWCQQIVDFLDGFAKWEKIAKGQSGKGKSDNGLSHPYNNSPSPYTGKVPWSFEVQERNKLESNLNKQFTSFCPNAVKTLNGTKWCNAFLKDEAGSLVLDIGWVNKWTISCTNKLLPHSEYPAFFNGVNIPIRITATNATDKAK